MANPFFGEHRATIGKVEYTLQLDMNVLMDVQDVTGVKPDKLIETLERDAPMSFIRAVLWACLQEHHADISLRDAGRFLASNGEEWAAAIKGVMEAATPDATDPPIPPARKAPRRGGTGKR